MKRIKIECSEEFLKDLYYRIINLENHNALRVPSSNEFLDLEKKVEELEDHLDGIDTEIQEIKESLWWKQNIEID